MDPLSFYVGVVLGVAIVTFGVFLVHEAKQALSNLIPSPGMIQLIACRIECAKQFKEGTAEFDSCVQTCLQIKDTRKGAR